jgi:glycosyltransferase involved in cell wall biosynthesis
MFSKMNIGVVVDNELNDDKRVLREISILKDDGYKIFVLCFGFDGKAYPEIEGVNITRIRISRKNKNTLFFFQNTIPLYESLWASEIKTFILLNSIEIIHAHDLYMSKAAHTGINKSRKNIPLILDLHENYPYAVQTYNWTKGFLRSLISRPEKWISLEALYLSYPDRIIVLSEEFSEDLRKRYDFLTPEKICPFPNVPDLDHMESFPIDSSLVKFKKKAPVILYFGVIAERRGIFEALEAFIQVIAGGHRAQFLAIGPVDKKDRVRFESYLNSPIIKEKIVYIPWIPLSELPSYLDVSDICLAPFHKNPQHESGVANKIYDYMLGSRPIIASDCKPQRNLIEKHKCGLVYNNLSEFQDSIVKLLDDESLRGKMGENGYRAVISHYNTKMVKDDLLSCYKGLPGE